MRDVNAIGPLRPWLFNYWRDGSKRSIRLYGIDPQEIIEEHCDVLEGLEYEGFVNNELPDEGDDK